MYSPSKLCYFLTNLRNTWQHLQVHRRDWLGIDFLVFNYIHKNHIRLLLLPSAVILSNKSSTLSDRLFSYERHILRRWKSTTCLGKKQEEQRGQNPIPHEPCLFLHFQRPSQYPDTMTPLAWPGTRLITPGPHRFPTRKQNWGLRLQSLAPRANEPSWCHLKDRDLCVSFSWTSSFFGIVSTWLRL